MHIKSQCPKRYGLTFNGEVSRAAGRAGFNHPHVLLFCLRCVDRSLRVVQCFHPSQFHLSTATSHRAELEAIIVRFNATFKLGALWPAKGDLIRFNELIPLAYVEIGNQSPKPVKFWNMVKAVDKRWSKVQVCGSIERMVSRCVVEIPPGPRRKLYDLLVGKNAGDPAADSLLVLLGEATVRKGEANWSEFTLTLDKLLTEDTAQVLGKIPPGLINNPDHLAWLKFIDVHRQALAWRAAYGTGFSGFAFWVYNLRNPGLFKKLEKIGWPSAYIPTQEEWQERHRKSVLKARQRKFRGKLKEKSPKSVTEKNEDAKAD